ncbi:MAG TPA: nuclear transport factor 2 family protein [Acidobacteriaceae bacterium]
MTTEMDKTLSPDEREIRGLLDHWAKAVREKDISAICAAHDPAILMFDVPPPLLTWGLEAYRETWERFFSWSEEPVRFECHDIAVTVGGDVAFASAIGRCAGIDPKGKREELEFRLTVGYRKIDGSWRVTHEHHSLPAV